MANPTALPKNFGMFKATTTKQSITLDPDRMYQVTHAGFTDAGADSETPIYVMADDAAVVGPAEGANKLPVTTDLVPVVGPGVSTLYYQLEATAADNPMLLVLAGPARLGRW